MPAAPPKSTAEPSPGADVDVSALPVSVEVTGRLEPEVRRYVEGILGWQPVDPDTARVVPPALRLLSAMTEQAPGAGAGRGTPGTVPTVLLLDEDVDAVAAAVAGARLQPAATLRWPADREQLAERAAALLQRAPAPPSSTDVVRVSGAAGGVGTSTVALALAGLGAWCDLQVLAVVGPGAPVGEVRRVAADALGAPDLLQRATPLPGVAGAAAVLVEEPVGDIDGRAAGADLVVVDAGRDTEPDVLVCRPDRAALQRLPTTTAGIVVVNGDGPVGESALARAAGGRRRIVLPSSSRVARAGLHARVPAGLPGTWLRRLLPAVPAPATAAASR
jgi:hypothetical protein